ncbi:metal-dependent hydrolase [Desulfoscipio geothermicus]|uniref:Inner membrane protein n=1 Tax=Desulfoscipio geothermicus DSM 3669 TaxID=1121426 RepID=A0A1I6DNS6_9FIRM|nr:metal-dependent hydrolase [Desulfoscipio geothermicus]SFR07099.1 inner membrane protein [Desulfoscipio geothermicus DSM 3669]
MLFPTHVVGGIAAGLMVADGVSIEKAAVFACVSGIAALLPDIDSPESFVGARVPVLPTAIGGTLGHRGATHSLLAGLFWAILIAVIAMIAGWKQPQTLLIAFLAGYISHLILDIFNPAGVPLLWPLPVRFTIPLMHTGGILEKLLVFPVISGWVLLEVYKRSGGLI